MFRFGIIYNYTRLMEHWIVGVKRVRREFIDDLWDEASSLKESDWKSSAREHLLEFEKQLHEAVDAGITHTSSGTSSWTLSNSIYYSTSLIFTLGIFGNICF